MNRCSRNACLPATYVVVEFIGMNIGHLAKCPMFLPNLIRCWPSTSKNIDIGADGTGGRAGGNAHLTAEGKGRSSEDRPR